MFNKSIAILPVDESRDHIQGPVTSSWAEWANTVENPIEK